MIKIAVIFILGLCHCFLSYSQENNKQPTNENIAFRVEQNLLNPNSSIREEISIQLETLRIDPNDKNFEFNVSAFRCYSHVLAENFKKANLLIAEIKKASLNDDNKKLILASIIGRAYLLKDQPDSTVFTIHEAMYPPVSHSDSVVHYYSSLIMASAYESMYEAADYLKWNKIALRYKQTCLKEEITYKDYRRIALAYERNELIDSSYWGYTASLKVAQKQQDSVGLFLANMDLGIFLSEKGDRAGGLEYFSKAEEYSRAASKYMQAAFHINCNINFRKVEHFEVAQKHLEKAEDLAIEIRDTSILGRVYQNWVAQYGQTDQLEKVPSAIKKSEELLRASDDNYGLGFLLVDKGHYYDNTDQLDSALYWYDQASLCFKKIENDRAHHSVDVERFITLLKFEQYDQALSIGLSALKMAELLGDQADIMDLKRGLSEIYYKKGKYKKAFDLSLESAIIKDTLEGIDAARQVNVLRLKSLESKRLELELEKVVSEKSLFQAQEELRVNRLWNYIMFGAMVLFIVFLFIILWLLQKSRKVNLRLIELDKQKDDLMHVVAHDLLSPIGKVGVLTELLRTAETESEKEEYMDYLDSVVVDSSSMVQNLMDIHAFESNKISLLNRKSVLGELVEDALIGIKIKAAKKNISLEENIDRNVEVVTDGRLIKRIVDNLVGNAVKFCPSRSRVSIQAGVIDKALHIEVGDNGPGFSTKDLENAFKKFSRLSARPTGEESSTGLGLAIVKELVSQLNGTIKLESEVGKGATFKIEIPLG